MNGILVADKPAGWTSHDVVSFIKKRLGAKKVGHLGTLDPLATGVLPLVIDGATKYAQDFEGGKKEYITVLKLGEETDTYDSEGKVVSAGDISGVTAEAVTKALEAFRGKIKQVPPMYSALKKNGTPLYKLARKGVTIEREAREIEIFEIELAGLSMPFATIRVLCSKGTYVRSICHDLGRSLGCGAHLTELKRILSGAFSIEEAVDIKSPEEELAGKVIPIEEALKRVKEAGNEAAP